jgi:hypothetical protein
MLGLGSDGFLILSQYPGIAKRRAHGCQLTGEFREGNKRLCRQNSRPSRERRRCRRTEDVKIPAREFEARVSRIHVGRWHIPDYSLARTVPTHQDSACWSGVPEHVWITPDRLSGLVERQPPPAEESLQPGSDIVRPGAPLGVLRQPSE